MTEKNKILVTGSGGFIGGRIIELLYLTKYKPFVASVKNWSSCTRIGRLPIEIRKMNLMDINEVENSLTDISTVIHCAYGSGGVTVEGTKNLLESCLKYGVNKIIHLSTIEVYTNARGNVTEEYECSFTGNTYGDSKLEAEKICREFMKKGLQISILRLPIVYGPFSRNWTINIANLLINRKLGKFEKLADGKCNLLYVDDLFGIIIKILENDGAFGEIFNINGDDIISWNEYFGKFNDKLGLPALGSIEVSKAKFRTTLLKPIRSIGSYLKNNHMDMLKIIASKVTIIDRIMRNTEKKLKLSLSDDDFKLFSRDAVYDISKAKKILSYHPTIDSDKGLELSAAWIRHQGFLEKVD